VSDKLTYERIEAIRIVSGTLPSEQPARRTEYLPLTPENIEVTLEDYSANPYKTMFVTSTATWGDNDYEEKWSRTPLEGKLEVIKAVLTDNTLPQAREMVQFVFRVRGVPRWLFDRHTHTPFTSFMSIGCRDNNKIDCDYIFPTDQMPHDITALEGLKDLYGDVLEKGSGSWQSARAFLPQCYQHSYHFGQNLLSISAMKFADDIEGEYMRLLYTKIVDAIERKFPLIGYYAGKIFWSNPEIVKRAVAEWGVNELYISDKELMEAI